MGALVSVIIPNFNHAPFLKKRIDSILNQTYKNFEIIILDDYSTDRSKEIIELYREEKKVSQIIFNKKNTGSPFVQWNRGIKYARGKYIWIAESDDMSDPRFLEVLLKKIECTRNIAFCFCQSYKINFKDEIVGSWEHFMKKVDKKLFSHDFIISGDLFSRRALIFKNVVPNASSVIFSKELFKKVGWADEDVKYCADWLLWLKLSTVGNVGFVSEPLNYFRDHESSVIAKAGKTNELFLHKYDILLRKKFNRFLEDEDKEGDYKSLLEINLRLLNNDQKKERIFELFSSQNYKQAFLNLVQVSLDNLLHPVETLRIYKRIILFYFKKKTFYEK